MKNGFRNWSDVRVFLAVIREGSTLAASRQLRLSQPTVARRIEALEHETGVILFTRDSRGFHPTDSAKSLLPLAEAIEAAATGFARKACDLSAPGPIRITAFTANFSPRVARIFSDFISRAPGTQFTFLPGVAVLDLMKGEADVALRITGTAPDPNLICRRISTARFTLYGTHSYAGRFGLPASPADLAGHRFVTFRRADSTSRMHDWLAARVAPEQIVSTVQEVELLVAAVKSGIALGIDNVRTAAADPDLIACFNPPEELNAEHLMLVSPEAYRRPEVRAFIKFFAPRYAAIFN